MLVPAPESEPERAPSQSGDAAECPPWADGDAEPPGHCAWCGASLGDEWRYDRSVLACREPMRSGACTAMMHDHCLAAATDECPLFDLGHIACCPTHAAARGFRCSSCGTYHALSCRSVGGRCRACAPLMVERRSPQADPLRSPRLPADTLRRAPGHSPAAVAPVPNQDLLWGGTQFRTRSELLVAQALERAGVAWCYEPWVHVTGDGGVRLLRAPDFLVVMDGVTGVLELDGAPHHGRAAYDHDKDRALRRAGVWVVERYPSARAVHDPEGVVQQFLGIIRHFKRTG